MKVRFQPKFFRGEVRSIYYQRLLKKARRVGADEGLMRRLETVVAFDQWECLVGRREIEGDPESLPEPLRRIEAPEAERVFLSLCHDPAIDVEWALYFGNPEETVTGLAEELELCE